MRLAPSEDRTGVVEGERVVVGGGGSVQVRTDESVPAWELGQVTVPPGRWRAPVCASATVAVQVEGELTGTEDGEQTTEVPEVRLVPVTVSEPADPVWSVSPE